LLQGPGVAIWIGERGERTPGECLDLGRVDAALEKFSSAASASGTTTWMLFCVPGVMSVMPSPNAIEHADVGGVTCTNLVFSSTRAWMSRVKPTLST